VARTFKLEILTSERVLLRDREVEFVLLPARDGYYGVLAGHAPMVGLLKPGVLQYREPGQDKKAVAVLGGFFEVEPERTLVMADEAEFPEEIDVAAALAERERTRAILEGGGNQEEVMRARRAYEKAMARLRTVGQA